MVIAPTVCKVASVCHNSVSIRHYIRPSGLGSKVNKHKLLNLLVKVILYFPPKDNQSLYNNAELESIENSMPLHKIIRLVSLPFGGSLKRM